MAQIGSMLSGVVGLMAGAAQARAERQAAEHNARVKERQATEEREAAQLAAREKRMERDRLIASQRALLAAEGQDLASGQPLLITQKAFERGEQIARITEIEGDETRDALLADADFERQAGEARARQAILGGFGSFFGAFG